jgi:uncharacterized membrane protein (UPF0136 family)
MHMTTLINLTGLQNATTTFELIQFANDASKEFLGSGILISLFLIITMSFALRGYDLSKAVLTASFACLIVGIMLRYLDMISMFPHLLTILIILGLSGFYVFFKKT